MSTKRTPDRPAGILIFVFSSILLVAGSMACNAVDTLTSPSATISPPAPTAAGSAADPEAAQPTQAEEAPGLEGPIQVLPPRAERDYEAELSLAFEGQNDSGEPAEAELSRHVINRTDPLFVSERLTVTAQGVPALVGPEGKGQEATRSVILTDNSLYSLRESADGRSCHQRELPAGAEPTDDNEKWGLFQVETYVEAASEAVELQVEGQETIDGLAVDHFQAAEVTIWTDAQGSLDVWLEAESRSVVQAKLVGEGALPPYGDGSFDINAAVSPLGGATTLEVPEDCPPL